MQQEKKLVEKLINMLNININLRIDLHCAQPEIIRIEVQVLCCELKARRRNNIENYI